MSVCVSACMSGKTARQIFTRSEIISNVFATLRHAAELCRRIQWQQIVHRKQTKSAIYESLKSPAVDKDRYGYGRPHIGANGVS